MTTSSGFAAALCERASPLARRVAFSEGDDPRVQQAVDTLAERGVLRPVLVLAAEATPPAIHRSVEVVSVSDAALRRRLADDLLGERGAKGLTEERAAEMASDPLYLAAGLVRHGEVDATVSGCVRTTGDVLRAALWLVGPAAGVRTVSSAFYMVVAPFRSAEAEVLTFTDCAVVPEPTAEQLAAFALAAARDRPRIVGDAAHVAFLSFSTLGSGRGPSVELVREASRMLRERAPDLAVEGEMQADAALIGAVAARKAPGSAVAGRANVLVFPSLDAGNIAYKLVERLAGASAIGPIVQGLARPCCDLSRGASVDDIIHVAAVAALQTVAVPAAGSLRETET